MDIGTAPATLLEVPLEAAAEAEADDADEEPAPAATAEADSRAGMDEAAAAAEECCCAAEPPAESSSIGLTPLEAALPAAGAEDGAAEEDDVPAVWDCCGAAADC
jgi:hypothetical protein